MTRFAVIVFLSLSMGQAVDPLSIMGQVLDPDGQPVTGGTVAMMTTANGRVTAAIARDGQFRIVPDAGQRQSLFISVPNFAPYRAYVTVPASRRMTLPAIQLQAATYFRARFMTADGEPLGGSIRRRSIDTDGASIPDPLEHTRERAEPDGTITIGPLPPGRSLLAFYRADSAQTRLRDAIVNGGQPLIDGGTITIGTGGTLHVDVIDGAGAVVPQHNVWIEDAAQPSPLAFMPVKTNAEGRAEFTRLAPGRYRVWTQTVERCGMQPLAVSKAVSSSGSGEVQVRLVVGGRARLRITSPLGPLNGKSITISPDAPGQTPWQIGPSSAMLARRIAAVRFSPGGCSAQTDAEGRVSVSPFPPGPAEVRIPLISSTYITRVSIPERGAEIAIEIPDGLIPVKVFDRANQNPVSSALAVWTGGGSRVEALTNATGDALIEAPGAAGGTLTISAREYETLEGAFAETPGTHQEIAMTRVPSEQVMMRVESAEGKPLPEAAVVLTTSRLGDADEIGATGANGVVAFTDVPPGSLRVTVAASGYVTARQSIPGKDRTGIVLSLKREP